MFKILVLIASVALASCGYSETTQASHGQTTAGPTAAPQTSGQPSYGQTTAQPSNGQSTPAQGGQGGSGGPCRLPNGQIVQSSSYQAPGSNGGSQITSGQNGAVSGNQVDVLPIGVNGNNILPVLNDNQIAIPICATNILNGNSILNPDVGPVSILAPVGVLGNDILSGLLRRRRSSGQQTSGQNGAASGNQVDVLPVGVNGNNVLPVANGNQIAAPIDLSNIANGNSILNPDIGSIAALVPVAVLGNNIADNLLGGGLPQLPLVGGGGLPLGLKK